jgi:hypothetical protein
LESASLLYRNFLPRPVYYFAFHAKNFAFKKSIKYELKTPKFFFSGYFQIGVFRTCRIKRWPMKSWTFMRI